MQQRWLCFIALLAFNIPIVAALATVPFAKRLSRVLKEKTPEGNASDATSYSRVVGAAGAIVLASFFWAIGNIVINYAIYDLDKVGGLLTAVEPFFLVGSALFLPYAFNQLKTLFPWGANASVAIAQMNQGAALALATRSPGISGPSRLIIGNLSKINDGDLAAAVEDIQTQINTDLFREWGVTTRLITQRLDFAGAQIALDAASDAIIYLGDKAQDPTAGGNSVDEVMGHHNLAHPGVPFGFVYLDACTMRGAKWSVVLSHEVLELLVDPDILGRQVGPDPTDPEAVDVAFDLEICDPVDGESYRIGPTDVSNFVTRRYFGGRGASSYTNQCRNALVPFGVRPSGYIQYWDHAGVQIFNGHSVQRGQLDARSMMGAGRRNARRKAAATPRVEELA